MWRKQQHLLCVFITSQHCLFINLAPALCSWSNPWGKDFLSYCRECWIHSTLMCLYSREEIPDWVIPSHWLYGLLTNEANTIPHPFNWNIISDLQGPEFESLSPVHKSVRALSGILAHKLQLIQSHLEARRVCGVLFYLSDDVSPRANVS